MINIINKCITLSTLKACNYERIGIYMWRFMYIHIYKMYTVRLLTRALCKKDTFPFLKYS